MENKEVEQIMIECMVWHPLINKYIEQLEKEKADALMVANCVSVNHKHLINLRKENAELKQQLQAKNKALDTEEKYKLALFMIVRNSKVMPKGIKLGKTMKEINQMSINACRDIMTSIDFENARKEYEDGID